MTGARTLNSLRLLWNNPHTPFTSLKSNKSCVFNDISPNVINFALDALFRSIKHVFALSIKSGIVPDKLKIARVTPVYKSGEKGFVYNYRPISVLPCFSKILERIMYNRLYSFLVEHDILYKKQFGFQKEHSTEHAILQLTNQILESFNPIFPGNMTPPSVFCTERFFS